MRRPPAGPRRRASDRPLGVLSLALLVTLGPAAPELARGQATRKAAAPPDLRPLARYVPREDLVLYLGSDGLDTQPDAWKKTAAYKLLNETNLGVMLEDVTAQLSAHALELSPNRKLGGADVVAIAKHLARYGFVFAVNQANPGGKPSPPVGTLVIRSVVGKEAFPAVGRLMGTLMGASRTQKLMKAGRYVVVVPIGEAKEGATNDTWAWWVEKESDLVIVLGRGNEGSTIAVMDGKRPNAVDHPVRSELARPEGGFTPIGQFFVDTAGFVKAFPPAGARKDGQARFDAGLAQSGVARFDYRWGFQDEALMTVTRLRAPRPRRGVLALLEQPLFDKGKLPPLPEGIESFTVASVDFGKVYDQVMASPTSGAKAGLTKLTDDLKAAARVDLRKDLLGHLLSKFAFYVMPGAAPPAAPAAPAVPAAGAAVTPGGSPLVGLLGLGQLPRFTLAAEVDDNAAASRTLNSLMLACNVALRAREAAAAESAPAPKGEAEAPKGRRTPPPAPEFRQTPSNHPTENSYVLHIPAALSRRYPAGLRPTIRLKDKQLIISTTPESARLGLEVKPGLWAPPADLASAFEQLPKEVSVLGARDPRPTLPETLAGLPGSLQGAVNAIIARNQSQGTGGADGAAASLPPGAAAPGAGLAPLKFTIPMTRMPKPEEIRERLFPGLFSVSYDDREVRVVSRVAFPGIPSPTTVAGLAVAVPAMQGARTPKDTTVAIPADPAARTKGAPKGKAATKGGGRPSLVPDN